MKKTYEAPRLTISGDVIRDTLNGKTPSCESENLIVNELPCPGGVGYHL